jgi:cytochrome c biogenesis protein CcmG/thiol:disulfide interchange protein DsbE
LNRKVLAVGLLGIAPLLAVLFANLGRNPHAVASPLVGKPAPVFSLPRAGEGAAVSLEGLRGRPVVLNFWATWCVPCLEEHPVLVRAARRLGEEVAFLGVVYQDQPAAVASFLAQHGSAYPSLLDEGGRTAIAYGVYGVPETYFLDASGVITDKRVGALDERLLARYLERARAGAPAVGGR